MRRPRWRPSKADVARAQAIHEAEEVWTLAVDAAITEAGGDAERAVAALARLVRSDSEVNRAFVLSRPADEFEAVLRWARENASEVAH